MGSLITISEGIFDILQNKTTAHRTMIDMIEYVSYEINLSFAAVRISEVKLD